MPCSVDSLVALEGLTALGAAEVLVLEKLSTQVRACIGTCGGGGGAAARGNAWRYLFGQLTIWIGERQLRATELLLPCRRSVCSPLGAAHQLAWSEQPLFDAAEALKPATCPSQAQKHALCAGLFCLQGIYNSQLQSPPSLRRQACLQIFAAACLLASVDQAYALSLEASRS